MHCAARLILFIRSDEMEMETLFIRGIPAVVWGELSHHVLIAVHGNLSHKTDTVIRLLAEAAMRKFSKLENVQTEGLAGAQPRSAGAWRPAKGKPALQSVSGESRLGACDGICKIPMARNQPLCL